MDGSVMPATAYRVAKSLFGMTETMEAKLFAREALVTWYQANVVEILASAIPLVALTICSTVAGFAFGPKLLIATLAKPGF